MLVLKTMHCVNLYEGYNISVSIYMLVLKTMHCVNLYEGYNMIS